MLQEVNDLHDLLLGPLVSRDVTESRRGPVLVVDLRLRASDAHDAAGELTARSSTQPYEEAEEEYERQEGEQV
jgi:hypothetical protein